MANIMIAGNFLSVTSIYVSHNSERYIKKFSDRHISELGDKTFLVNSSNKDIEFDSFPDFEVINTGDNIGFSAANNLAINAALKLDSEYFLIINPDVYLPALWLSNVLREVGRLQCVDAGLYTVPLLGYDFEEDKPSGLIDSLGVAHTFYGRWHDVLQGCDTTMFSEYISPYEIPAACGALMLIPKTIVCELLEKDGYVFNEAYFMYKEDIELSIRIKRLGKKIMMLPAFPVYHCRGWEESRADSPYWARKLSARNELIMHLKYCWRFLPYSFLKYFYVSLFEDFGLKLIKRPK